MTRWDEWFSEGNLLKDERILSAPPSRCAEGATSEFLARGKGSVLDLACGVGRDTFYLESRGLAVTGVDASCNGLRAAQRVGLARGVATEFAVADARHLPFGDGSFEGVYCFGLLHEFTGASKQEDVQVVMSEIARVLCDEGVLALAVLAGQPEEGLPAVKLFTRGMFEEATKGLQAIQMRLVDDIGCTGRSDYRVWYGTFQK